jgi:hypothetical protein
MSISALSLAFNGTLTLLALILAAIEGLILRHEAANSPVYMRWRKVEVILIVAMGILGVPAFVFMCLDSEATARDVQEAKTDAKAANQRAENVEEAAKPWLLSDEAKEQLRKQLKEIPIDHDVQISMFANANGAADMATQLRSIFRDAEKNASGEDSLSLPAPKSDPVGIHFIVKHAELPNPVGDRVLEALIATGIPVLPLRAREDEADLKPGEFKIIVGRKPRSPDDKPKTGFPPPPTPEEIERQRRDSSPDPGEK